MTYIVAFLCCLQWGIFPFKGGPQEDPKEQVRANFPQLVFLYLEIMDEKEFRYVFSKIEDFQVDFEMIISRYKELKYAPPLYCSEGFPDRSTIIDLLTFNKEYEKHLVSVLEICPENSIAGLALSDTRYLYHIWDLVRDSTTPFYYIHIRRKALKKLKEELDKIDPTWFYQRRLPNHVPMWAFSPIR